MSSKELIQKWAQEQGKETLSLSQRKKEEIKSSLEEEHKQALQEFYEHYSEISILLYCIFSLILALLVIGGLGALLTALSTVAPPAMAILILSPQTIVTVFVYSLTTILGLFGLSFLLKRPWCWSYQERMNQLCEQALEDEIDANIRDIVRLMLQDKPEMILGYEEKIARLQATLRQERSKTLGQRMYGMVSGIVRRVLGGEDKSESQYCEQKISALLWERYTRIRQKSLTGYPAGRMARFLAPYKRLGLKGIGKPSYRQVKETLSSLHIKVYNLDKEILESEHDPSAILLEKRKLWVKRIEEQEKVRNELWFHSIPVIGGSLGWMRGWLSKTKLWPASQTINQIIERNRGHFLEAACLHMRTPESARKWYTNTINWDTEERHIWLVSKARTGLLSLESAETRQVSRDEYQEARKVLVAMLHNKEKEAQVHLQKLQTLLGEEYHAKAYIQQMAKRQLSRWLRILSAAGIDNVEEGHQSTDTDRASVAAMVPGSTIQEKIDCLKAKLGEFDTKSMWQKLLGIIGWETQGFYTKSQEFRHQKEDALMYSRIQKTAKSTAGLGSAQGHLQNIEQWRIKNLLGRNIDDGKPLDSKELGIYSAEEVQEIVVSFNNSNYLSYLYQVLFSLSTTKLHKTLDLYECKLSYQMAKYGKLDEEHKKILSTMEKVRAKLKKDEEMDLFKEIIYPFTLLQGVIAALASSVVEPIFGGVMLTTVSGAGLVNNMRLKGRKDSATYGFLTSLLIGVSIIALQSVLIAGVNVSGAALAVAVLAAVGATLSFCTWVIRGAKRSIDSEKNINPRISMATSQCFQYAVELDEGCGMDQDLNRQVVDEEIADEVVRKSMKAKGFETEKIDWILERRQRFFDAKTYVRMLVKQQTNLIRTIKNGLNKDVELAIITERCENIAQAYHNNILSKEAASSMLQPLLHAKTVQENHTNRNYLYLGVSVPAVTMGFVALSSLVFPLAPLVFATVLVVVQVAASGVFTSIHMHQYKMGAQGMFYREEPKAENYLAAYQKGSLVIRKNRKDLKDTLQLKNKVIASLQKKTQESSHQVVAGKRGVKRSLKRVDLGEEEGVRNKRAKK